MPSSGCVIALGIGPGDAQYLSAQAQMALEAADLICGYTVYVDLVRAHYPHKAYYTTGMTAELERCHHALREASMGKTVAMVCSGDAGIYGMAGLLYELAVEYPDVDIEGVPGITAALAGAALLGAPLCNDFAVVSLSNQLTPWETIERRLHAVGAGDFALCLYNPRSRQRPENLRLACEILLSYREAHTPCGIAQNIGREGQYTGLLSLEELRTFPADMFTTLFVGNSQTRILYGKMVTLRGYEGKA